MPVPLGGIGTRITFCYRKIAMIDPSQEEFPPISIPADGESHSGIDFGGEIELEASENETKRKGFDQPKPDDFPSFRIPIDEDYF
jgi:hypothetical protein